MQRTLIWDLPTRLFHWTLAGSFALAWLTSEGDQWRAIHVFLGYLILGLVAFRLVWGFAGSHFSRFSSFWFSPKTSLDYLKRVATGQAPRHIGHNPTGSLAIYMLLAMALAVGITGIVTLGGDEQQGLAAGWFSFAQIQGLKQLHQWGADIMLLLVGAHIAGVVVESLLHKENLAMSMVTGYKVASADTPKAKSHALVAALLLTIVVGFGLWWFFYAIDRTVDSFASHDQAGAGNQEQPHVKFVGKQLADSQPWRDECGSCHAVFYPALLPSRSWQRIMAEQNKHFGTDLGLDEATKKAVLNFLLANAAEKHQVEAAFKIDQSIAATDTPMRVTETPYWVKKHKDIATSDWANPLVLSKGNCAACHADADQGTYEDGAMSIPAPPAKGAANAKPTIPASVKPQGVP
jgi:cytochrome b